MSILRGSGSEVEGETAGCIICYIYSTSKDEFCHCLSGSNSVLFL